VCEAFGPLIFQPLMCRKFKENQIARGRQKLPAAESRQASDEEQRQEVEILRKELENVPLESVRWGQTNVHPALCHSNFGLAIETGGAWPLKTLRRSFQHLRTRTG
jgi:septum formation topological specificity factor MinE